MNDTSSFVTKTRRHRKAMTTSVKELEARWRFLESRGTPKLTPKSRCLLSVSRKRGLSYLSERHNKTTKV